MEQIRLSRENHSFIGNSVLSFERNILEVFGAEFLSMEKIDSLIGELAQQIRQDPDFEPDYIVGILNGGYYVTRKMAENLRKPYSFIDISRKKRYFSGLELNDRVLFPKLLRVYQNNAPELNESFEGVGEFEKILLVDDDAASGETFNMAEREIKRESNVKEVKTSCLFVCKNGFHPTYFIEEMQPINSLIRCKKRFPWRSYSPYIREYKSRVQDFAD